MKSRITIEFTEGLSTAYPTMREFIPDWLAQTGKPMKAIAADMDYSPSQFSRKIHQFDGDTARLTVDDLERLMIVVEDYAPIAYLAEKYYGQQSKIEQLEAELAALKASK